MENNKKIKNNKINVFLLILVESVILANREEIFFKKGCTS